MKRKIILTCCICAAALCGAEAQQSAAAVNIRLADEAAIVIDGQTVTIGDAIRMALDRNSDILAGKYELAMADSNYRKYDGKYSPYIGASVSGSMKKYNMDLGTGQDSKVDVFQGGGGFTFGKNFSTGTNIALGFQHNYINADVPAELNSMLGGNMPSGSSNIPQGKTYKYHMPTIFASLEQEFLQNMFGYNDRRQTEILKRASEIQTDKIKYQLSQIVVGVVAHYWNVILYKTQLDNAETMLRETQRVRGIIGGNVRLGLTDQFQLNFWNATVASAETQVAQIKQQFRDASRDLQRMFNIEESSSIHEATVLCGTKPNINIDEALKIAYEKRADYAAATKGYEAAVMQKEIASNAAMPSLKGTVTFATTATKDTIGDAYTNAAKLKSPSLEAQIEMVYVLDNKNQETEERDARYKVEQAKINLTHTKRAIKDDVNSKAEWLTTGYDLYQKAKTARSESEIYYNKVIANLRYGRLSSTAVLEALRNMISGRNNELALLINYNALILQFEVAKNTLFEKYDIDVDSYLPADGEYKNYGKEIEGYNSQQSQQKENQ